MKFYIQPLKEGRINLMPAIDNKDWRILRIHSKEI